MDSVDQFIAEVLPDAEVGEDTPFAELPDWDSLKHVELIVGLEGRFGVQLTAAEIAGLTCKRAVREVLAAKGRGAA